MKLLRVLDGLGTLQSTSTSGGNKTNLHTWRSHSGHGRWVTNMLMVTTTVWMLYRVHSHTSNLRPAVSLDLVLVVGGTGLEQRLLGTTATSDLANHGSARAWNELLGTTWELDTGESGIRVVGDDDSVRTGGSGDRTSVSSVPLNVADDRTLRHGSDGKDVSDGQGSLLSRVDELTRVETLGGAEGFLLVLVSDRVPEGHSGEWCTSTRVVNKVSHDTLDITLLLAIIKATKLGCALSRTRDGLKDTAVTLTLSTNNATHPSLRSSSFFPTQQNQNQTRRKKKKYKVSTC